MKPAKGFAGRRGGRKEPGTKHRFRPSAWAQGFPGCIAALLAAALNAPLLASAASIAQQAYIKASNTESFDFFGYSVAVSGNTMVIGAAFEDSASTGVNGNQSDNSALEAGAAYVFVRTGTNWVQQAYLKASNAEQNDVFGRSVAVSGDTVIVGAVGESCSATGVNGDQNNNSAPGSGAAYIFVRNGTNWTQQAYLKASTATTATFGTSVAVSGGTAVVGATGEGAAYVFVRQGTNWTQQAYLKPSNTEPFDVFGLSVAVSGNTVVVGARGEDSNARGVNGDGSDNSVVDSGAAYVFVRNGTQWTQQAYLKASNTGAGDYFGDVVAVSGDTVVVGARLEDSNGRGVSGNQSDNSVESAGAVYVFVRNGTSWSQQAYLKASNPDMFDQFGYSVAVSGGTIVVGAIGEASNATGVNGNQLNFFPYQSSGAAYVFSRSGTNWSQQAYLKASNPEGNDEFGWSVGISGDTVVIGANEGSSATGVNGDQNNNGALGSGVAYVFSGVGFGGPRIALIRDGNGGYFIRFSGSAEITYAVQRATRIFGPWDTLATLTTPVSGLLEFHDTTAPPGQAFYRTRPP